MPCETCNQSYLDSYEVDVAQVRATYPDISEHDLRVQVAKQFRIQYREWKHADVQEKKGDEEYENGDFTIVDGKIVYPKTGETAESLHANQKQLYELYEEHPERWANATYKPSYSATDHETTLLVQEALTHGASVVKTVYGREGNDNRDVIEFRYDKETNRGKIIVHNEATDGNFHSFETIKHLATASSVGMHETNIGSSVFILSDVKLEDAHVTSVLSIPQDHALSKDSDQPKKQSEGEDKHAFIVSEQDQGGLLTETARKNEKRPENPNIQYVWSIPQDVIHETVEAIKQAKRYKEKRAKNTASVNTKYVEDGMGARETKTHDLLLKKPEKALSEKRTQTPAHIRENIDQKSTEPFVAFVSIQIATKTGEGIGGALYILHKFEEKHDVLISNPETLAKKKGRKISSGIEKGRKRQKEPQKKTSEVSLSRQEKRLKKRKKRLMVFKTHHTEGIVLSNEKKHRAKKKSHLLHEREKRKKPRRAIPHTIAGKNEQMKKVVSSLKYNHVELHGKERLRVIHHSNESKSQNVYLQAFDRLFVRLANLKTAEIPHQTDSIAKKTLDQKKEAIGSMESVALDTSERVGNDQLHLAPDVAYDISPKDVQMKTYVTEFSLLLLWFSLFHGAIKHNLFQEVLFLDRENTNGEHEEVDVQQKDSNAGCEEREGSPWILLAIIWYLGMIREGGMSSNPRTIVAQPQKQQVKKTLPHQGVIYAYAPHVVAMHSGRGFNI